MSEPFDTYSDVFVVSVSAWGANLSFQLQQAHPNPTQVSQPAQLGTVRMSNEHLKTMAFVIMRQMMNHERDSGVRYDVPTAVLSQLGIAREDWDSFWGREGD